VLTLDESIEIAKGKSFIMLRLEQDLKIAEYNLKSATNRLKTNINLRLGLPQYTETVRQWEDSTGVSFFPVKQLSYTGNLTINQPLPTDGNIFIQSGLSSIDNYYNDIRSSNLNTRIGFVQPLDAFYGYNSIRSTLKRAELAHEQTNKSLKREELNLVYQVSSAYYNLLSLQKSTEIAALDLERQTEAHDISQKKYQAGLIKEVDALQMEVDLAEAQNNYDIAILNQESATNSFKELLGISLSDMISLKSELSYKPIIIDPEKAIQQALANRMEIREQEIQIDLQKLNIKQQKAAGKVRANIEAYYERVGVSTEDKSVEFFNSLDQSLQDLKRRPSNFGIGLTITIPILDWGVNRSLVRATEARQKQNLLRREEVNREIETEVRNLVAGINSNLKRLQLLEKNVEVAEKSFSITLGRYTDGDIDSESLALERNRLNTAYTSHLRAYINYQLSLADLMRKTFYDFQNDRIIE
jgi:outer membrane protein TolC